MDNGFRRLGAQQTGVCPAQLASYRWQFYARVARQALKTSPTVQAWAMHPRGVNGASPSKISLNVPRPCEVICFPSDSRKLRAALRSWYTRKWAKTNGPTSQPHTVP